MKKSLVLAFIFIVFFSAGYAQKITRRIGPEASTIDGTGMGILSAVVAVNHGWVGRDTALKHLIKIVDRKHL